MRRKYELEYNNYKEEKRAEEQELLDDCMELEKDFS